MKQLLTVFAIFSLIPAVACPLWAASAPQTIPAIQEWTTGTGTFVFTTSGRIVVNTADSVVLFRDAKTFAADLNGMLNRTIPLACAASPSTGDIFLSLGATDTTVGNEGYLMNIGSSIQISARAVAGVFYGTRTALQMLKQSTTVNQGSIRDWPKGKWRGVMLDVGRKFYTVAWIQSFIRDMAYVKYNQLHLHLSDGVSKTNNGGFRIQCDSHPEIVSTDYYSKATMQSFIDLAGQYHITIVPEIDLPGHATWLYATHKNLLLNQRVLGDQYWALDLTKDSTYAFIKDLYDELIPFFPGPYFHIGADEYMFLGDKQTDEYAYFPQLATWAKAKFGSSAIANDCYRYFVNWADSIVKSKGKITMAWNDILLGLAKPVHGVDTVAKDIHIDYWGTLDWIGWGGTYDTLPYRRGAMMLNTSWDNFYVVGKSLGTGDPLAVYSSWELYTFAGKPDLPAGDPQILGGKLPIWGDVPTAQTEDQVLTSTFQLERAIAQKVWGAPKRLDSVAFQTLTTNLARAAAPVTGISGPSPLSASMKLTLNTADRIQLFSLDGRLVFSCTPGLFAAARQGNGTYRFIDKRNAPAPGLFMCRFKGNGRQRSALVRIVP